MVDEARADEELQETIHEACHQLTDDPMRSNVVGLTDLMQHDEIREQVELTDQGLRSLLGRVLTHSEYAEEVSRGNYRITNEAG